MTALYLEIDGEPIALTEAAWVQIAPCGCACAITTAALRGDSNYIVATEEEAWKQLHPTKPEQKKYRDLGFIMRPEERRKGIDLMSADCPHDPKWGKPPIPTPDGMAWAVPYRYNTPASARLHLWPSELVDVDAWTNRHPALCGTTARGLSAKWYATDGRVECSRCMRKAAALERAS